MPRSCPWPGFKWRRGRSAWTPSLSRSRASSIAASAEALVLFLIFTMVSCGKDEPTKPPAGPPSTVTDLRVAAAYTLGLRVCWTAPGAHNTEGVATRYDLRYATSDTTAWEKMEHWGTPPPRVAGSAESLWVRPLQAGTRFSFRLAAVNADSVWSPPSNRADGATIPLPDPGTEADTAWWNGFAPAPGGAGVDGGVRFLRVFRDNLMACGSFMHAGSIESGCIAAWNGSAWQAVGGGVRGGSRIDIRGETEYEGDFVVVGKFATAGGLATGCVARWDGAQWSAFGDGIDGIAERAVVFEGDLLVSGGLILRGSGRQVGIARWDGIAWSEFGSLPADAAVLLTVYRERLYTGVRFLTALDQDAFCYVFGWQGDRWEPALIGPSWIGLPFCCPGLVDLGTVGDRMVVVGTPIGLMSQVGIFDGSSWQGLNPPVLGRVDMSIPVAESFGEWRGRLVIGGWFRASRTPSSCNVTVLDGGIWKVLGSGIGTCDDWLDEPEGEVRAVAEYQGDLYVGGGFAVAGLKPSQNIARWRGSTGDSAFGP